MGQKKKQKIILCGEIANKKSIITDDACCFRIHDQTLFSEMGNGGCVSLKSF